jgi:hypothetical protein
MEGFGDEGRSCSGREDLDSRGLELMRGDIIEIVKGVKAILEGRGLERG